MVPDESMDVGHSTEEYPRIRSFGVTRVCRSLEPSTRGNGSLTSHGHWLFDQSSYGRKSSVR